MRRGHWLTCAVVVPGLWASAARATIVCDFVLQPGGLYNPLANPAQVPEAGGWREISVFLRNTEPVNNPFGGFQFDYQADKVGASAVGAWGGWGSSGQGSRFNSPDWDATPDLSVRLPSGAIPTAPSVLGMYGTTIAYGDPNAASHLVGWIVVHLAPKPAGSTITIRPVNFQAFGLFGDNLDAAYGSPATFVYVPEPGAGVLLLVAGGGLLRGRRQRA